MRERSYAMNMLPGSGWIFKSNLSYEWNQFMDGFAVSEEYSTFGANFVSHNTARFLVEAQRNFTVNRNRKIVETDYLALSDVTMSDAWKTYRQSLRDITNGVDTVEKAENVTWPTKPS